MKCFAWFLLASAAAWAQPHCTVRGVVTDDSSGKTIDGAKLFLMSMGSRPVPSLLRTTGEQGAFCFEAVDPGSYMLEAQRSGYLNRKYGDGMILAVSAGSEVAPVEMKLVRRALLSGAVVDAGGEPVAGAGVTVYHQMRTGGGSERDEVENQETDDRGSFRFGGLKPGTYFLGVKGPNQGDLNVVYLDEGGVARQEAYMENFYSSPVVLEAGKDVTGLLLTTRKTQVRHISGKVSGKLDSAFLGLEHAGNISTVAINPDGTFFLGGLEPGPVTIEVRVAGATRGRKEVDLTGGDADGVVVSMDEMPVTRFTIPLQFRTEGAGPQFHPPANGFVFLQRSDANGGSIARATAEGTLQFPDVPPGLYNIVLFGHDEDFYMKRILVGGQAIAGRTLDFRHGTPGAIQVTMAAKSAAVEGHVLHEGALSQAVGILFEGPDGQDRAIADQNGVFHMERMEPGKYRLFAMEGFNDISWSTDLATALQAKAVAFEVGVGEKKQVDAPLISARELSAAVSRLAK